MNRRHAQRHHPSRIARDMLFGWIWGCAIWMGNAGRRPGAWIQRLPESARAKLRHLRSDDLRDVRVDQLIDTPEGPR